MRRLPIVLILLVLLCNLPAAAGRQQSPQRLPLARLELCRLTSGPGLRVRFPRRAWGTPLAVKHLREVAAAYRERFPRAPPIWVHDMSKAGGGRLPLHFSHRDGRDADLRLLLRDWRSGYVDATPRTLDVRRTGFLILALIRTCDVEFIMLDRELQAALVPYLAQRVPPDLMPVMLQRSGRWRGAVVRHRPRHRNHFHVRFRREGEALTHPGARQLCTPPDPPILRIHD